MSIRPFLKVVVDRSEAGADDFGPRREANSRIASNLAVIARSVGLQAATASKPASGVTSTEARFLLAEIAARVDAVGRLQKTLSSRPAARTDIGEQLRKMCAGLKPFIASAGAMDLFCDFTPGCIVRSDQIIPIARIVTEVVMNAVIYAHPSGVAGRIDVSCRPVDKNIAIEVCDDGVGLPENFDVERGGGVGFKIIRTLAAQLGATPIFESSPRGLRFQLLLPRPK
jgi:two-component sensor histidine kinase